MNRSITQNGVNLFNIFTKRLFYFQLPMDKGNCLLLSILSQLANVDDNYKCVYLRRRIAIEGAMYPQKYFVSIPCKNYIFNITFNMCLFCIVMILFQDDNLKLHLITIGADKGISNYSYKQFLYDITLESSHLGTPEMDMLSSAIQVTKRRESFPKRQ